MSSQDPVYNPTPVLPVSVAVLAAANALLATALTFGLPLTAAQDAQIQATLNAFVLLAVALSHARRATMFYRDRWSHLDSPTNGAPPTAPPPKAP